MRHKVVPILKVAVMGMAALVVNVQAAAETRSDVLERIKPVGQVTVEGGAQPAAMTKTEAAPAPQAATPEAKAEPAPAQVATVPAAATGGGDGAALYQSKVPVCLYAWAAPLFGWNPTPSEGGRPGVKTDGACYPLWVPLIQ